MRRHEVAEGSQHTPVVIKLDEGESAQLLAPASLGGVCVYVEVIGGKFVISGGVPIIRSIEGPGMSALVREMPEFIVDLFAFCPDRLLPESIIERIGSKTGRLLRKSADDLRALEFNENQITLVREILQEWGHDLADNWEGAVSEKPIPDWVFGLQCRALQNRGILTAGQLSSLTLASALEEYGVKWTRKARRWLQVIHLDFRTI